MDPELPVLAEAFADGAVTAEHVRVIIRVLSSLSPHLGEHRTALEADLVAHARTPRRAASRARRPRGRRARTRGQARDERSTAERNGDGLVELARRLLAVGDLGVENGQPVALTVTVPLETLTSGVGAGLLGFGAGGLSAAIAAQDVLRLACDARVVPVVLGAAGEPLSAGRESRLATRAQRRALAQRDGGCAFAGCEVPPQWCVAHHVTHWAAGGATDLDNLVLLCPHHHRMVHRGLGRRDRRRAPGVPPAALGAGRAPAQPTASARPGRLQSRCRSTRVARGTGRCDHGPEAPVA